MPTTRAPSLRRKAKSDRERRKGYFRRRAAPAPPSALAAVAHPGRPAGHGGRDRLQSEVLGARSRYLVAPQGWRLDRPAQGRSPHGPFLLDGSRSPLGGLQLGLRSPDVARLRLVRASRRRGIRNAADSGSRLLHLLDGASAFRPILAGVHAGGGHLLCFPL